MASWHANAQSRLAAGIHLTWKDPLESFSFTFAKEAQDFEEHVDAAFGFDDVIEEVLENLATCEYTAKAFSVSLLGFESQRSPPAVPFCCHLIPTHAVFALPSLCCC